MSILLEYRARFQAQTVVFQKLILYLALFPLGWCLSCFQSVRSLDVFLQGQAEEGGVLG